MWPFVSSIVVQGSHWFQKDFRFMNQRPFFLSPILARLIEYEPGDIVPESGIYDVVHDKGHKQPHQVTAIKDKRFPPCRGCQHGVRFRENQQAIHLHDHPDFETVLSPLGNLFRRGT